MNKNEWSEKITIIVSISILSVNVHVVKLLLTLFIYIKRCRVIELSCIELIDWFLSAKIINFTRVY